MCVTFWYEGRTLYFGSLAEEVCNCHCHRFFDRPNCLRWAEPCCYRCNLCGRLIKKGVYHQHYRRHLEDNGIRDWEALTIAVDMAMSRARESQRSLG